MATAKTAINWKGHRMEPGPWIKPETMPYSTVIDLYANDIIVDVEQEDFGLAGLPLDQWEEQKASLWIKHRSRPCPNCVRGRY